jgi:hypothetical protein
MYSAEEGTELDARLAELTKTHDDCLYFAVTLTADTQNRVIFATQTEWAGWSKEDCREELRRARLVYPAFTELWIKVGQPYIVVHTADEVSLFLLAGGNALIEQDLARSIFPRLLSAEPTAYDGESGFISADLLDSTAFRRAPTPKLRMKVLVRDGRRCRVCGRNPDDHLDLELHVHHIRPWEKGGVTDPKNLITLCQTCHSGLDPHHDPSLFSYLRPKSENSREASLRALQEGVANYRRVGFLSGLGTESKPRSDGPRRRGKS